MSYERNENIVKSNVGAVLTDIGPDLDIDPSQVRDEMFQMVDSGGRKGEFRHTVIAFGAPATLNVGEIMVDATNLIFHETDLRSMDAAEVFNDLSSASIKFHDPLGRVWHRKITGLNVTGAPNDERYNLTTSLITESDVASLPQVGDELIIEFTNPAGSGALQDLQGTCDIGSLANIATTFDVTSDDTLNSSHLLLDFGAVEIETDGDLLQRIQPDEVIFQRGVTINSELAFPGFPGRIPLSTIGEASLVGGFDNDVSGYASVAFGGNNIVSGGSAVAIGDNNISSADYSIAFGLNTLSTADFGIANGFMAEALSPSAIALGGVVRSHTDATAITIGNGFFNGNPASTRYLLSSGLGSINVGNVTSSYGATQTGAAADRCFIAGGVNNEIINGATDSGLLSSENTILEATATNTIGLGLQGQTISESDAIILRNLWINETPATDNTLLSVLSRDPATEEVKEIEVSSLLGTLESVIIADPVADVNETIIINNDDGATSNAKLRYSPSIFDLAISDTGSLEVSILSATPTAIGLQHFDGTDNSTLDLTNAQYKLETTPTQTFIIEKEISATVSSQLLIDNSLFSTWNVTSATEKHQLLITDEKIETKSEISGTFDFSSLSCFPEQAILAHATDLTGVITGLTFTQDINISTTGPGWNIQDYILAAVDTSVMPKEYIDAQAVVYAQEEDDFTAGSSGAWVVKTLPGTYTDETIFITMVNSDNNARTAGMRNEATLDENKFPVAGDGSLTMEVFVNSDHEIEVYAQVDADITFNITSSFQ